MNQYVQYLIYNREGAVQNIRQKIVQNRFLHMFILCELFSA